MWLGVAYIILSVVMGVSTLFSGAVYAGLAGIAGPALCWVASSRLRAALLVGAVVQKIGGLLVAIAFVGIGMGLVYSSGYSVQLFGHGLTGITWCAIGVVLGYIAPMKQHASDYEYQPALLHAKTMVIDGRWVTVGSTNLDPRSFALSEELNLIVYDRAVAGQMDDIFTTDLSHAKVVDYESWRHRGMRSRLFELLAFPMRDLF